MSSEAHTADLQAVDLQGEFSATLSQKIAAATIGVVLGAFLLIGVAFAGPDAVHNAAHDARHAGTFPCH